MNAEHVKTCVCGNSFTYSAIEGTYLRGGGTTWNPLANVATICVYGEK